MNETVEVLVLVDEENKIYYTEDKTFNADSEEAKVAQALYSALVQYAKVFGYQIVKKVKDVTYTPDGEDILEEIDLELYEIYESLRKYMFKTEKKKKKTI